MDSEVLYQIALTKIKGVGDIIARNLLEIFGSEERIFKTSRKEFTSIKGFPSKLIEEIHNPKVLEEAEKEMEFVIKNKINTHFILSEDYPRRLKECADAPILLYSKGDFDFNAAKVVSIIGTRKSTNYGNNFCDSFLEELASYYPDVLIISGLAYGIDINAHKAALKNRLATIGILAHGLDRIYPSSHRKTAIEMLENGGLLTEFPSMTEPDKFNFVKRNRIIAGMADAVIVVESDIKGGSLITADIANSYNRDVFAVPGRVTDNLSKGCNKLIADNKAALLVSAEQFIEQMGWNSSKNAIKPRQQVLFPDLSPDEQAIYDLLALEENIHVNDLSAKAEIPVSQLFYMLLEMEMKGIIEPLPGGQYKIK